MSQQDDGDAYCSQCGAKVVVLANRTAECKNCGSMLDEDEIIFKGKNASAKKMKKNWEHLSEFNGYTLDDLSVDYARLVDLYVKPNGHVIVLYDTDGADYSGRLEGKLKGMFGGDVNPMTGMDYTYDTRGLTHPIDFCIGRINKDVSKMKKSAKPTIEGLLAVFEGFEKDTLHWNDIVEYLEEMHEDEIDEDAMAELINQYRTPTSEHDWYFTNNDMWLTLNNSPYNASFKKSYTPEYHDFRTMLTNMKMTKNNRTVFKR